MTQYNQNESFNAFGDVDPSVQLSGIQIESSEYKVVVPKQIEQILDVLDQSVEKLEMVFCMPLLLENNAKRLRRFVTREELEIVRNFNSYKCEPVKFDEVDLDLVTLIDNKVIAERDSVRDKILRRRRSSAKTSLYTNVLSLDVDVRNQDSSVAEAVHLLFRKPLLLKSVKTDFLRHISFAAKIFLHYVYKLQNQLRLKILTTPKEEAEREKKLRRAWNEQEPTRVEIVTLMRAVSNRIVEAEHMCARKELVSRQERDGISEQQHRHKSQLKIIVNKSECAMAMNWRYTQFHIQTLQRHLDSLKLDLEDICHANLLSEREIRNKKYKTESQLLMLIGQFDNDMKDLQREMEHVQQELDLDRKQLAELQERFYQQEVIYEPMVTQRTEEEQRLFEDRMYRFLVNRSARRILRYYRAYRARKLARKRKLKQSKTAHFNSESPDVF